MPEDPYSALGLANTATADEIKKAYKRIARESHPDLNPGDPKAADRFKAAAAAHDLLKDPEQRARFDRGEIDAAGQERPERRFYRDYAEGPEATYHTSRGYQDFGDFSDVFSDLFGEGRRSGAGGRSGTGSGFAMRGADQHYVLELGFLEAARGATRRITLPGGSTLDVKIPEGIADGQVIRLRGKGGEGQGGGAAGDALVTITVAAHPTFRREGNDIHLDLPVSIDEAILGAKVETPTIAGPVALSIPPGASSGRMLRLKGRGVRGGDQFVTLRVMVPAEPDPELQEFLRGWRDRHPQDPRKGMQP